MCTLPPTSHLPYPRSGWKWTLATFQMFVYVTCLLPGFIPVRRLCCPVHAQPAKHSKAPNISLRRLHRLPAPTLSPDLNIPLSSAPSATPQMVIWYIMSPRVIKNVAYGPGPRQQLDLYIPEARNADGSQHAVVIFITGAREATGAVVFPIGQDAARLGCVEWTGLVPPIRNSLNMEEEPCLDEEPTESLG